MIAEFNLTNWDTPDLSPADQQQMLINLEQGKLILLPSLPFNLTEQEKPFLSPHYVDPETKNISYDITTSQLKGTTAEAAEQAIIQNILHRYAATTLNFIYNLFPRYKETLKPARTSLRPVEIKGRVTSYRKDDTRLHVDAFTSTPMQGKRILRVFTNINLEGQPRHWRVGEPFKQVAEHFLPRVSRQIPGSAKLQQWLGLTRSYRTPYDHIMLQIHNAMKADMDYQQKAEQQHVYLQPGSSWIVYTDQVSHAAMAGQHVLEQSFYLPVSAMQDEQQSPLRVLEKLTGRPLI